MKIVYQAENIVDATLVRDWLVAEELSAFVFGDLLVGGMGGLPAAGLIAVLVADSELEQAEQSLQRMQIARQNCLEEEIEITGCPA